MIKLGSLSRPACNSRHLTSPSEAPYIRASETLPRCLDSKINMWLSPPKPFTENIDRLGIRLHGLNLMAIQNHRVANPSPNLDVRAGLNTLPSLFTESTRRQNLTKLIEENQFIKVVQIESQELNHWSSHYLDTDHVLYPSTQ